MPPTQTRGRKLTRLSHFREVIWHRRRVFVQLRRDLQRGSSPSRRVYVHFRPGGGRSYLKPSDCPLREFTLPCDAGGGVTGKVGTDWGERRREMSLERGSKPSATSRILSTNRVRVLISTSRSVLVAAGELTRFGLCSSSEELRSSLSSLYFPLLFCSTYIYD